MERVEGEEWGMVESAGHEGGMAIPLVPACEKQNSEEGSLAL